MLVSLNWLTDYVDIGLSIDDLSRRLTGIGLNVEGVKETDSDVVIDLEVTSNRPDCLGHLGVAREIAAATGAEFRPPVIECPPTSGKAEDFTRVDVEDADLCPRYTARVVRGVRIAPSPAWLVQKLQAVGMRSVNNVVDVTNFVLMEYSQPLHSFDLDKLDEGRIVVRRGKPGETLMSIDETECRLNESMLVITDASRAVAIAGIMGGLGTEVTGETTNLLIESAQFDPLNVRHTSRTLQLMSESNYRFERGVDSVAVDTASLRACQLIVKLAGGELAEGVVDVWAEPWRPPSVSLRPARTEALLGIEVTEDRQVDILRRLGLQPVVASGKIVCTIPSHRPDLSREVDLIEEVARMVGYDSIPVAAAVTHPVAQPARAESMRDQVGRVMSAAGFDEAVTFTFVDAEHAALFGCPSPVCVDPLTRRANNALRPTLLPSLLAACKTNQDVGNADVSLYELAAAFPPTDGPLPAETRELAMVTTGDLRDLRGAVDAVIAALAAAAEVTYTPGEAPGMAPGQAITIRVDGNIVGAFGRIAPEVQDAFDLEHPIAAAAMSFSALVYLGGRRKPYQPLPRFPAAQRDLSLIVDEDLTWAQVAETVEDVKQPLRVAVDYVTTYRGKPVEPGRKSVTLTLVYRSDTGTLRSEQVDEQVRQVVAAADKKLKAELRQ